jgi:ATP-dependent Lon protease
MNQGETLEMVEGKTIDFPLLSDDSTPRDSDDIPAESQGTKASAELLVREIEAVTGHRLNDAAESARWIRELAAMSVAGDLSLGRYAVDAHFRHAIDVQLAHGQPSGYGDALRDYLDVAARLLLNEDPGAATWFDAQGAFSTYFELSKSISTHSDEAEKLCHRVIGDLLKKVLTKHRPATPDLTQLIGLVSAFPNLEEPISFIAEHLAIRKASGDHGFAMPPILLVGPPGIGKTYLSCELSRIIDAFPRTIHMATVTHGFVLSGTDRKWGQAAPGAVVKAMMDSGRQTPIIVLDEIDKAGGFQNVLGPLYTLLDPAMATKFVDEFLGFEIDASGISWIATANEKNHIPEPLLDRFQCFDIPPPSKDQLDTIVNNMYRGMAGRIHYLPADLPDSWKRNLGNASLREVGRELQRAIGRVALARELDTGADIDVASAKVRPAQRKRIGF